MLYRWLRIVANRDRSAGALGRHFALLASLVLLMVGLPLGEALIGRAPNFAILLVLVLLAAVVVQLRQRAMLLFGLVVGVVSVVGIAAAEIVDSTTVRMIGTASSFALLGVTTVIMLNSLLQSREVSRDTLVGGICVYLLIGLCFALLYILMNEATPGSFEKAGHPILRTPNRPSLIPTELLYYSFVTLTTLGYGDITPVGDVPQMFSAAEAVVGQLYLTIFVARLVALYVSLDRRLGRRPRD